MWFGCKRNYVRFAHAHGFTPVARLFFSLRDRLPFFVFFVFYVFFVVKNSSADFVRDPGAFSTTQYVFSGALFHWQARTPAVDADVDPPKRKALTFERRLRQLLIAH